MTRDECQRFLEERLIVWQRRLRLQDWIIRLEVKPAGEANFYTNPNRQVAGVKWDCHSKQAIITVLDPEEFNKNPSPWEYNPERSMVHELLHLLFCHMGSEDFDSRFETAIEMIEWALTAW